MVSVQAQKLSMKDKVGYALGDCGNNLTFFLSSSYLMVFYMKVMGINPGVIGTLFMVARIIDAITDVTVGRIVDIRKPSKDGKYRPWIKWFCGPVAILSFLMYQSSLADMPMGFKIAYMYVTYILWGSVFYTAVNIPYGSMAMAITQDPGQRTVLSTYRGYSSQITGLVLSVALPLIVYTSDAQGNQIMDGDRFTLVSGILSLLAVVSYILCYRWTTERVKIEGVRSPQGNKQGTSFFKDLAIVLKNRAFIGTVLAAIFLLLALAGAGQLYQYLYIDVFANPVVLSIVSVVQSVVGILVGFVSIQISNRFGKKEAGAFLTFTSALVYFILYFLNVRNAWIFCVVVAFSYIGMGYINMVIWANIGDVIDDQEVRTGRGNVGLNFSVYSFARKLGSAFAGGVVGWGLEFIGYDQTLLSQTETIKQGIYNLSTLIPGVSYLLVAMSLFFIYPLTKEIVEKNGKILQERRTKNAVQKEM
jgi:GPH family glycoside/pentoside/hexuronide:cation symporter